MRGNDLLDKMELVDPSFVEEADREPRRKKHGLTKYGTLAACLAIIISAAVIPMNYNRNSTKTQDPSVSSQGNYIVKHVPEPEESGEGIFVLPQWDDMVDAQRYTELQYSNINYGTRLVAVHKENVGEKLGEAAVIGQDFYTHEIHSLDCDVFAVRNIDPKAALCVKFSDGDQYAYAYVNSNYFPETLGELIDVLDLSHTLSTGIVYDRRDSTQTIAYEDVAAETVWNMLLCDTDIKNERDKIVGAAVMSVSVNVDLLGYRNVTVSLTEDGYLKTNILDTGKYFYIGEERVNEFIEEVTGNHQGYIYIYYEQTDEE